MQRVFIFLPIVLIIVYTGCSKPVEGQDAPPQQADCNTIDSRFAARVLPIIQNSCATNIGCHAAGSVNGPGALTSYIQISNASAAIKIAVISGAMPRGGTLTADEKNIITCWVNSGAPNN